MKIAIVAAGFTPAEADELRRSMATFKAKGLVNKFEQKLIQGMINKGYTKEYAHRIFKQLEGFGSYGFPESHAASFAQLVYVSSWLKCYYPDVFACAILNSLPMGFYQPAQLVSDARKHGVEVREADINYSYWDHCLEERSGNFFALRLGFRIIKGLKEEDMQLLVKARSKPFTHINQLRDIEISPAGPLGQSVLVKLAEADAFRSLGLDRRQALWQVSVKAIPVKLYKGDTTEDTAEQHIQLPRMQQSEHVVQDYASTSLSIKAHPVSFVREKLNQVHAIPLQQLEQLKGGEIVKIAGLVLVKQRPETASGVCFMTLEDESGIANLVIFENIFNQYRREILQSRLFMAEGKVQREEDVIHVVVSKCYNVSRLLHSLTVKKTPQTNGANLFTSQDDETAQLFPKGRNFH